MFCVSSNIYYQAIQHAHMQNMPIGPLSLNRRDVGNIASRRLDIGKRHA